MQANLLEKKHGEIQACFEPDLNSVLSRCLERDGNPSDTEPDSLVRWYLSE